MNIEIENLNTKKALELLLSDKYKSEFENIDGFNQHPEGKNFYDWLYDHEVITNSEHIRINGLLKNEL